MAAKWATLPKRWSNKNKAERLDPEAYASLTRMMSRAVAETNTNFSIWSALRTHGDQVKLFKENYTPAGRGRKLSTDRSFQGKIWKRKPGGVSVASPDLGSNHQDGLAIDIHPSAIQSWMKSNGERFGWSWDEGRRVGESWHFRYIPSKDTYRSEGLLDHAAVQMAVGADADGKIGTATVAKIKEFQKKHGLEVDGKVGPATKKALGLAGKDEAAHEAAPIQNGLKVPGKAGEYFPREEWTTEPKSAEPLSEHPDRVQTHIYIHYPGAGNVTIGRASEASTASRFSGYWSDHVNSKGWADIAYNLAVDQSGNIWELRGIDRQCGANGGSESNRHGQAILVVVGNNEQPTADCVAGIQAAIAAIREQHPQATTIRGHRQSPDASTSCPGEKLMALVGSGALEPGADVSGIPVGDISESTYVPIDEDGRFGVATGKALQAFLNNRVNAGLKLDGRVAEKTWLALQKYLSAPYKDGKIDRQSYKPEELGNGIVDRKTAWGYTGPNSKGSQTIELLQEWVGAKPDGILFEGTTRLLQRKLNYHKVPA